MNKHYKKKKKIRIELINYLFTNFEIANLGETTQTVVMGC